MADSASTPKDPPVTSTKECCICGKEATQIVFSSVGYWKVCDQPACWNTLTERYEDTGLTWMAKPLSRKSQKPKE